MRKYNLSTRVVNVPKCQLNLYVPTELVGRLTELATKSRFPRNQLAIVALDAFVDANQGLMMAPTVVDPPLED